MGGKAVHRNRAPQDTKLSAPQVRPKPNPKAKPPPPPAEGLFPDLGVNDETKEFGPLASGARTQDIDGIIQHRTESPSMESTRNAYRTQMKKGNHVGAHYLVGADGDTSLTVPTDKTVSHVRGNKDKSYKGANARTIGIENVGMAKNIDPRKDIRKQVEALDLPPQMRARLLAMDDKALKRELADSENMVHTDITGQQKRANWNLVNALAKKHGLDIGTDVQAHEDVDHKTLGEAEPIKEFLTAMQSYPGRIAELEKKLAKLEGDGTVDPKQLEMLRAILEKEKATQAAVAVDKTPAENNALEGEKIVGTPGPATARENDRTDFYKNFWPRSQRLDRVRSGNHR